MDWMVDAWQWLRALQWNGYASYNLGSATDGVLLLIVGGLAGLGAVRQYRAGESSALECFLGVVGAAAVASIGLVFATRGLHWYIASAPGFSIPGDGSAYAPWANASRHFLAPFLYLMAALLATNYSVRAWLAGHRHAAVWVVVLVVSGYVVGGLTPLVPK